MEFDYRMFLIQTYSIRDVHYYADYSKVKSTWTVDTSVSGRTIYNYLNAVGDTTVEFKLKNLPNNAIVGIGRFSSGVNQIKNIYFRYNSGNQQWHSTDSRDNNSRNISQTVTANSVFKFVISNTNTISFYVDDVLVATDNCKSSFGNTLRIDDFTSTPLDLDYVIVV